jgi:hypothetical protein
VADYTVSITLQAVDNASQAVQQLNTALQGVGTEGEKQKNQIPEQTSMWQNYTNAINSVSSAIGIAQTAMSMLGSGLEVIDLGENVHAVSLAFQALQGDAATAANTLQMVRDATSGVLSDVDIMSAVNRMQSMGLADSAEGFSELIGMAQQLGSVMSPNASAAQNIDNFTLLLANQSVRRLDSFGISADAVRQRIEELKAAGLSSGEAFNQATLEQGRIALENLGSAADAGATNVDRLATRWENFKNQMAEGAADIVNQAAGTLEMLATIVEAATNGTMTFDPIAGFTIAGQDEGAADTTPYGGLQGAADASQDYLNTNVEGYSDEQARQASAEARARDNDIVRQQQMEEARAARETAAAYEEMKDAAKEIEDSWDRINGMSAFPDAMKEATDQSGILKDNFESLVSTTEQNAANLAEMERAAISLNTVLGTTSGGLGGEITGDVAAQMADQGMSQEDIDAYNRATGLQTGAVTQSSIAYEDTVVPMITNIYNQFGAEAAATATMNVQTGMQNAELMGLSDEAIAANMGGMTGYRAETASDLGLSSAYGIQETGRVRAEEGFDIDAYSAAMGEAQTASEAVASALGGAEESMKSMDASSLRMVTNSQRLVSNLSNLPRSHTMTLHLAANTGGAPAWLVDLIQQQIAAAGGGGGDTQGQTIPGTDGGQ